MDQSSMHDHHIIKTRTRATAVINSGLGASWVRRGSACWKVTNRASSSGAAVVASGCDRFVDCEGGGGCFSSTGLDDVEPGIDD